MISIHTQNTDIADKWYTHLPYLTRFGLADYIVGSSFMSHNLCCRPQASSALFFQYNTQLGPPYHILIDTNFVNFSIKNKLDIIQNMMDCLYAKCKWSHVEIPNLMYRLGYHWSKKVCAELKSHFFFKCFQILAHYTN